jgi:hypothetical protein
VEALRAAHRGRHHSEETRQKLSATLKAYGTLVPGTVPFTPEEDELVKTLPTAEAARQTGRTLVAVSKRQRVLGLSEEARERLEPSGQPPEEVTGRIAASSPRSIDQRLF